MLERRPYLCNLWLTCSVSGDGAKESCDGSVLIRNCDCIIGPQQLLYIFQLLVRFVTCSVIDMYRSWAIYPITVCGAVTITLPSAWDRCVSM